MRYDAKVDRNQAEIVDALRKAGCSVTLLHRVGQGCPDLLVGKGGVSYLLEVKMPGEGVTLAEAEWHFNWRGQVAIVYSVEDALAIIQQLK